MKSALPGIGCASLCLLLLGCSSSQPASPDPHPQAINSWDSVAVKGGVVEGAIASWELHFDPANLTAHFEPLPGRAGQDNGDVYMLPVDEFYKKADLTIDRIRWVGPNLQFDYSFRHPFPDSALIGRADLGFSGRFAFGVAPNNSRDSTWFEGDDAIVTAPSYLLGVDGYLKPKGLLPLPGGISVNTFPYQLLVDERGTGNRWDPATGDPISNGGSPTGNFTAPDGWQGTSSKDWTGYGVLHQGQAVSRTLTAGESLLDETGSVPIITVLFAKYADPKSASPGFEHRKPVDPPDVLGEFGYRMPHGALDLPRIAYVGETGGFIPNEVSSSTLGFHITDWDARAMASSETNLSDEPNTTLVTAGAAGMPTLEICIPDVLGDAATILPLSNTPIDDDSAFGGDPEPDSGMAGDELFFAGTFEKPAGIGQFNGDQWGFIRATDVEDGAQDYLTYLSGDLVPLTDDLPSVVTYQAFTVTLGSGCGPNEGVGWGQTWASDFSDSGARSIGADSTNQIYAFGQFEWDTDFGGGTRSVAGVVDWYLIKFASDGTYLWDKTWGGPRQEYAASMVIDGNDKIWLAGSHQQTFNLGGSDLTAVGFSDPVLGRFDTDGNHEFSMNWHGPEYDAFSSLTLGPADELVFSGSTAGGLDLGGGPIPGPGDDNAFVALFSNAVALDWARAWGGSGAAMVSASEAALNATGEVFVAGSFWDNIDVGLGPVVSNGRYDGYLVQFSGPVDPPGWARMFGGTDDDIARRVGITPAGGVVWAGNFEGTINLGGSDLTSGPNWQCTFLATHSADGSHSWSRHWVDDAFSIAIHDLEVLPDGGTAVVGQFSSSIDFGGGPLPSNGSSEGFIMRRDASGAHIWSANVGSSSGDSTTTVDCAASGVLLYGGWFSANADLEPGCGQTVYPGHSSTDAYLCRMTENGTW